VLERPADLGLQVAARQLLEELGARVARQAVEHARGMRDADRDLLRRESIHGAAAIEQVDEQARRLGEQQACGQDQHRAPEQRARQEVHQSLRATCAART
jgi:hypothetical protein